MNPINRTMDRDELLTKEAAATVEGLNALIRDIYSKGLNITNWFGYISDNREEESRVGVGMNNRSPDYSPLPGAVDDGRFPWYLYWESYAVLSAGTPIGKDEAILDAGGTSSLFSSYLASLGPALHSIDINNDLIRNANELSKGMGWNMTSHCMDMSELQFEDNSFSRAYSICVFEHLDFETKKRALKEIARCLKPGGTLSITFDYKNPAPDVFPTGPDVRSENQLSTKEDIVRAFLSTGDFRLRGNNDFHDNGKTYLVNRRRNNFPYTFGAIFLEKR